VATGDAPSGKKPEAETDGSMDIILDMEKPEIILIEDQLNINTNALVVDVSRMLNGSTCVCVCVRVCFQINIHHHGKGRNHPD
jgi:hypothetical protein